MRSAFVPQVATPATPVYAPPTAFDTPVLIVGAGPVGLALAGDLGWRGIPCILVEKSDGAISQPKMDMVGVRSMEFCRRWGIVPWVEGSPYPRDYPQDNVWVSSMTGWEFGRERMPGLADEPCPAESPQKRERCPQDMFDPILTRFARSFAHVQVRYSTELLSFAQDAQGVTVQLQSQHATNDGEALPQTLRAQYLVGCDGAASLVRQSLGIAMQGQPVLTYTTNVIFRCPQFTALHDKGRAYRFIIIGEQGTWATLVAINGRDRWRFSIVGSDSKRSYTEDEVREAIVRAMGQVFDFEILSMMHWVRRELVADRYGEGRVQLAGDAVHLTSPTGGFGMNTGIQDAVGLSWALEACLRGWGGAGLLQAYERERRPVALRNVREASGNLSRMLSPRVRNPGKAIFAPGPQGDAARAAFGEEYTAMMKREWYTNGIHLGYRYEGSPVIVPDGTPEPPDEVSHYVQTARPGHRAPHVWLAPGRSTLDLFGRGFVLLCLGATPDSASPVLQDLRAAAADCGLPLTLIDLDQPEVLQAYVNRLVLVRPDGHVAWRGDSAPQGAAARALMDRVRGVSGAECAA